MGDQNDTALLGAVEHICIRQSRKAVIGGVDAVSFRPQPLDHCGRDVVIGQKFYGLFGRLRASFTDLIGGKFESCVNIFL